MTPDQEKQFFSILSPRVLPPSDTQIAQLAGAYIQALLTFESLQTAQTYSTVEPADLEAAEDVLRDELLALYDAVHERPDLLEGS